MTETAAGPLPVEGPPNHSVATSRRACRCPRRSSRATKPVAHAATQNRTAAQSPNCRYQGRRSPPEHTVERADHLVPGGDNARNGPARRPGRQRTSGAGHPPAAQMCPDDSGDGTVGPRQCRHIAAGNAPIRSTHGSGRCQGDAMSAQPHPEAGVEASLTRQLLDRSGQSVLDVVEHLGGMNAQTPHGPSVGLYARIDDFQQNDLDVLLRRYHIVKANLMRAPRHRAPVPQLAARAAADRQTVLPRHLAARRPRRAARCGHRTARRRAQQRRSDPRRNRR